MGLLNLGDVTSVRKKVVDGGNCNNFPHTKKYTKGYSDIVAGGLFVILAGTLTLTYALDFFCPEPQKKGNNNGNRFGNRGGRDNRGN